MIIHYWLCCLLGQLLVYILYVGVGINANLIYIFCLHPYSDRPFVKKERF